MPQIVARLIRHGFRGGRQSISKTLLSMFISDSCAGCGATGCSRTMTKTASRTRPQSSRHLTPVRRDHWVLAIWSRSTASHEIAIGMPAKVDRAARSQRSVGREPWLELSLYAGNAICAGDNDARERLLRYCLRAPLSLERLSIAPDGNVIYQVKATRHGNETQRIMTPTQFMARLVALLPRNEVGVLGQFRHHLRAGAPIA